MEPGTIIGLATLTVGGTALLAMIVIHRSSVQRSEPKESDQRIDSVVTECVRLVGGPAHLDSPGPGAFIRAGAKNLKSSDEIRQTVDRIEASLGEHESPLGRKRREDAIAYDDLLGLIQDLNADASNWNQVCDSRGIPEDG